MILLKCCTQYASKFGKPSSGHRTRKGQFFIPAPKRSNAKECSNYHTITIISHAIKVVLKLLQARFQQIMNQKLPNVQTGFRKGRGTRDQIANICWIIEKAKEFQKNIYFCFIDYAKLSTVWITKNCGKFLRRWEYETALPATWETCVRVMKQQLVPDMKHKLVQNWERSTPRLYIVTLLI